MFENTISTVLLLSSLSLPGIHQVSALSKPQPVLLAQHSMSLDNRYADKFVNDVFKDNILLTEKYLEGSVQKSSDINWDNVTKPFTYEFKLEKGQTFAFHKNVLPEYKESVVRTTNAYFSGDQGFKTDGYLIGDGVCHLASLMYWVAKDAGLDAKAPTNHDFAVINEVPKEDGVAIFTSGPQGSSADGLQNLYITNNQDQPVTFKFEYDGVNLKFSALKDY